MVTEPRFMPSVTVGAWKSGSKQKKDWPNFQLCCHKSFHLLELSRKSAEKLEIYLWRLFVLPNGDWICPWARLGSTLSWFRGKNIDALSHGLALIFGNTSACPQPSTFLWWMWGTRCSPGLLCHGGCWQMRGGESLPNSWKFSPSPPQGKGTSITAHPLTSREHKLSY